MAETEVKQDKNETNGSSEITPLEQKIINQIEYYFGDINLARDRFLQEKIREDEGYVTLEVLLTFNRLKELSEDAAVIVAALKKSSSGLMEVAGDETKIRRSPDHPLPENTKERREELNSRSVYCKGFPDDSTLDTVNDFMSQFGTIESIYLRRNGKTFKGSIFAVFKTKEDADKFLKADSVKNGETELKRLNRDEYFKKKLEEKRQAKLDKVQALKEQTAKEMEEQLETMKERITKGAILHLEGFASETTREDVRNFFEDFSHVAWVDFNPGDEKGQVRFSEENNAQVALDKAKEANGGKITLCGADLTGRVLEGDEEMSHWKMIFNDRSDRNKNRNLGRRGRGRGRGKFGSFKGKRRNDGDEGAPNKKSAKTE